MKSLMSILAMVVIATMVSVVSKAQYAGQGQSQAQSRPIVKAIDSVQIAGVPVNAMSIAITSLTDSVATVQSSLRYVGNGRVTSVGQISFRDTLNTTPSIGMSINSAASRVAAKHGVRLK
jgi:hypothetical protein